MAWKLVTNMADAHYGKMRPDLDKLQPGRMYWWVENMGVTYRVSVVVQPRSGGPPRFSSYMPTKENSADDQARMLYLMTDAILPFVEDA